MSGGFEVSSMVTGYHVCKDVWEAAEGECLECAREVSNRHDPYAVAIKKMEQQLVTS